MGKDLPVTSYRELAPPARLEGAVACVWQSHDRATNVLPDACVDIVFGAGRLTVAGPATRAMVAPPTPGSDRFGVRFRVGSAGAVLGIAASELLNDGVPIVDIWGARGRRLEERVADEATSDRGLQALISGVAELTKPSDKADLLVRHAALLLTRGATLRDAARDVGCGERQLRRRFERAVGYGPATFVRIQRFQRFLALAEARAGCPLARLAADAGYADQSHLTRESRRLAGMSPMELVADGPIPAGDKSVSFNPSDALPERLAS